MLVLTDDSGKTISINPMLIEYFRKSTPHTLIHFTSGQDIYVTATEFTVREAVLKYWRTPNV